MGALRLSCAKVRDPSELQFGLVHVLGRGIAVLDRDPRGARCRGGFRVCDPHFGTHGAVCCSEVYCQVRRKGVPVGMHMSMAACWRVGWPGPR